MERLFAAACDAERIGADGKSPRAGAIVGECVAQLMLRGPSVIVAIAARSARALSPTGDPYSCWCALLIWCALVSVLPRSCVCVIHSNGRLYCYDRLS